MKTISMLLGVAFIAVTLSFTGGCTKKPAPSGDAKNKKKADEHNHDHEEGPHGGAIVDWDGGKYHAEFTVDHDKQQATVYLMGPDASTPLAMKLKDGEILLTIKEPAIQVTLKAQPQKGEADGKASVYVGTHKDLATKREFEGTLSAEHNGNGLSGPFKEEAHKDEKKDKKK